MLIWRKVGRRPRHLGAQRHQFLIQLHVVIAQILNQISLLFQQVRHFRVSQRDTNLQ